MNISLNKLVFVWNDCNNNNDWYINILWMVYLFNFFYEVFKFLVDSIFFFFVYLKFVVYDFLFLRSYGY